MSCISFVQQARFNCTHDQESNYKLDIPEFTGQEQPEEELDWLNEVERISSSLAINLKGYAPSWWPFSKKKVWDSLNRVIFGFPMNKSWL